MTDSPNKGGAFLKYHSRFIFLLFVIALLLGGFYYFDNQPQSLDLLLPSVTQQTNIPREVISEKSEKLIEEHEELTRTTLPQQAVAHKTVPTFQDVDISKIQQLAYDLSSGTEDEQIEAVRLLSKTGTLEQKEIIKEYALNPSKEISVRLSAVENIDWEQNTDVIKNLIIANNEVGEAAIYMAGSKELSNEAQASIDDAVYSASFQSPRPSTQIAILDYFLERHSNLFDDVATRISFDEFLPQEREEIEQLLQKRKEENDLLNNN